MKNLIAVLATLLLFSSCDVWDSGDCNVVNNTNREVTIRFYHEYLTSDNEYTRENYPDSVVVLEPYSNAKLFTRIWSSDKHPMDNIDSVVITSDSGTVTKDMMLQGNWDLVVAEGHNRNGMKKADLYYYTFTIRQEDIE